MWPRYVSRTVSGARQSASTAAEWSTPRARAATWTS